MKIISIFSRDDREEMEFNIYLKMGVKGFKNVEIAKKIFYKRENSKIHINRIFREIKVSNRLQAAFWWTLIKKTLFNISRD